MNIETLKSNKILLALVVFLGAAFLAFYLTTLSGKKPVTKKPVEKGKAVFLLSSQKVSPSLDETFTIDLTLKTNGEKLTAADAYLTYNPEVLEVLSLTSGKIFSNYPNLKVKKLGEVLVSGLNNNQAEFAKDGVFATIEFKAKSSGKAQISLTKKSVAGFEGRNVLNTAQLPSLTTNVK